MGENNKSSKKFAIGFIIFITIVGILTFIAVQFTFQFIDENYQKNFEEFLANTNDEEVEFSKKQASDKKYALTSYSETYSNNPLTIQEIDDDYIHYIKIEGLKNEQIQNQINERIKNTAYNLNCQNVYASVSANFSNVLSIFIAGSDEYGENEKIETINIDLGRGKDIRFEDVFVSSASINLYLANALYESLAWNFEITEDVEEDIRFERYYNMDYRDTSEYEDKFLMIANKYKSNKDNLKYTISPQGVHIYDLAADILETSLYWRSEITIDFVDCIDQVAIYKRYLTNNNIYNNTGEKPTEIVVLTKNREEMEYLNYGKVEDGLFVDQAMYKTYEEDEDMDVIKDIVSKLAKEEINKIKAKKDDNEGMMYQAFYNIYKNQEEGYYEVYKSEAIATCTIEYFENNAFRDYIKMSNCIEGGDSSSMFFEWDSTDELKIENMDKEYYFSFDGELLENVKDVVEEDFSE